MNPKDYLFGATFPEHCWRPDLFAMLVLAEFARTDWHNTIKVNPPEPFDSEIMKNVEIPKLTTYEKERADRFAEIVDQDSRLHIYFAQALMLSPSAHPNALRVIEMAYQVGLMVVIYYKQMFNRGRPQQVCPAIMPIIPGPMHPSYPSGHSLQSHMIAEALASLVPGARDLLVALADRIGHNREIAGVHFKSDTDAGRDIALQAFRILADGAKCPIFAKTLAAAQVELGSPAATLTSMLVPPLSSRSDIKTPTGRKSRKTRKQAQSVPRQNGLKVPTAEPV